MALRPADEAELQKREAIGVIRASRFIRKYARTHKSITIQTVCEIHREIFKKAWPEIAGIYRTENLEISDSKHHPSHHSHVPGLMKDAEAELKAKLMTIEVADGVLWEVKTGSEQLMETMDQIIRVAAWLHHKLTFVHPFREGNGRTARLAGNLILERHGLVGISIKVEKENKNRYRRALAQADAQGDYEPLVEMMYEGLMDRYSGVGIRYYETKKK